MVGVSQLLDRDDLRHLLPSPLAAPLLDFGGDPRRVCTPTCRPTFAKARVSLPLEESRGRFTVSVCSPSLCDLWLRWEHAFDSLGPDSARAPIYARMILLVPQNL